jgi:hypothetical protein
MKITTETIRQLIKEELKAVLEGRTIYAPGPVYPDEAEQDHIDWREESPRAQMRGIKYEYRPTERGSQIDYDEQPADPNLLPPELRDYVTTGKIGKEQAKLFHDATAVGRHKQKVDQGKKIDQYFHDRKRVGSTELDVQIKEMEEELKQLKAAELPASDKERWQLLDKIDDYEHMLRQLKRLQKDPYGHTALKPYSDIRRPRRPLRKNK